MTFALPLVTFKNQSIYKGNTKEVKLSIEGMDCDYCVRTVTERLNRVAGVVSASVSLSEKSALVYIQQEKTTAAHLIQAIERAGFEASLVTEKSINNKK
ncbi:MAG: heavy-metal-associated domain-containing protein [Calditrichia bacterium]